MKKIFLYSLLFTFMLTSCATTGSFETLNKNAYCSKDLDINGHLFKCYLCETDTQLDNVFKYTVKKQLGSSYHKMPNLDSIRNNLFSLEYIEHISRRVYEEEDPFTTLLWDYYKQTNNIIEQINWDNYKYCWLIYYGNIILLYKTENSSVYTSICSYVLDYWEYNSIQKLYNDILKQELYNDIFKQE